MDGNDLLLRIHNRLRLGRAKTLLTLLSVTKSLSTRLSLGFEFELELGTGTARLVVVRPIDHCLSYISTGKGG